MIRALAIDDEPAATNTLRLMVDRYVPEITEFETTNNPQEAIQLLAAFKPDLVFLNIQMPVFTGFDLLKALPKIDFEIIFTTAFDQYAIQAIRYSALDYLLKPLDADELKASVQRFIETKSDTEKNRKMIYDNLLHNIKAGEHDYRLAVSRTEGTYFYEPNQIIRLEAESNYTRFFFTDKKPLVVAKTLGEYEELLGPQGFLRTHRTHLVNPQYVDAIANDGVLLMKDGSRVEISRRRREDVIQRLKTGLHS